MVGWFARATQVLRQAPPEPQAFELSCGCGNRVSGMRRPSYQKLPCNRCGKLVFVLPADVYPKSKKKVKKKSPVVAHPDLISTARAAEKETEPQHAASKTPEAAASRQAVKTAPPGTVREERPGGARRFLGSLFSPLRLTVLAVLAVTAATGYWIWQSQLKETAARSLRGYVDSGEAALRGGDLPSAAQSYQNAAQAVDRLGRSDPEAQTIRRKSTELKAAVGLSAVSLYDICDDARRTAASGGEKWKEKFNQLYRNAWVVVEGDIIQDAGPDGAIVSAVRYPFPIDQAPVVFDAGLKALEPLVAAGRTKQVIFAGQLASLAKEGTTNPVWMIRLNDATAFVWIDADTYRALGLGADGLRTEEDIRRILNQQAVAVGIKP